MSDFDALTRGGGVRNEGASTAVAAAEVALPAPPPCNIILYGPPGTGKTYSTVRRALELILGADKLVELSDHAVLEIFREHQARGQIEFVTFHQSYGYEEFVEGIRPVLDAPAGGDVRYELHDGAFKRIAMTAAAEGLIMEAAAPEFEELWRRLVEDLTREDGRVVTSSSGKTYQMQVTARGNVEVHPCELDDEGNVVSVEERRQTASRDGAELLWNHRTEFGAQPSRYTSQKGADIFSRERGGSGGHHFTAYWIVYSQLHAMSIEEGQRELSQSERIKRVQQALDKKSESSAFTFTAATPQYVLIIDEINRGNVSKILGELITLLEADKRIGSRGGLRLPLTYSPQHRFAVPPNLHVIGTMNTADRSIALMDVALRRRFTFEELLPHADVVRRVLRDKNTDEPIVDLVVDVFQTINDRIRFLYDRDHQLGHAYFLDATSLEALRRVLVDCVVPMLQEYFHGSWERICIVLGCPYDDRGKAKRRSAHLAGGSGSYAHPVIAARSFGERATLGFDHDELEDRVDHDVVPALQRDALPIDALARTFLGILDLDATSYVTRLEELTGREAGLHGAPAADSTIALHDEEELPS